MLYFYYCQAYKDKVNATADKIIRKRISGFGKRSSLKGINSVVSHTGAVSVLTISNPYGLVVLQEDSNLIDGHTIYFVRDFLLETKVLLNYVQFKNGTWITNNPLNEEDKIECERTINSGFNQENIQIEKLIPPSSLTSWHSNYKLNIIYDIYETEEWMKFAINNAAMRTTDVKLFRILLQNISKKINDTTKYEILTEENCCKLVAATFENVGIVYTEISLSTELKPLYLLHGGAHLKNQSENWESLKKTALLSYNTIEEVRRIAFRAYPNWALNNDDLWVDIQKNSETGNLSLLPEQTEFLLEFKFPSYINGQAGSGKSTMLYYLFANAYYYKCAEEIKGDIIFITENENLLEHTKKSVRDLLQTNPNFDVLTSEHIIEVADCFKSFKKFLYSLLVETEDKSKFDAERYLDFSKFRILYEASSLPTHIKKRYTPETIWFAISTYIYGYDLEYQITSENYDEKMPREGRFLISKDELRGMEQDVFPFYRRLLENENYWDKPKIIRYIKENIVLDKQYEVVFCDEAQDFSRIELRFILSLSEYIKYNLAEIEQVPIVFAGDELQTVSPTGFRSAEVKDMLYKELKDIAGFNLDTQKIEYVPKYNYRSSQSIVNVANAIQHCRKYYFQANIQFPQIAKSPEISEDFHLNIFLNFNSLKNNEALNNKLLYKTFIVPANTDDKDEYISNNFTLEPFKEFVKSAVETKGIDYSQVVIYGFGAFYIDKYGYFSDSIENDYEQRFFFNKLYVAVTRARTELIIIDSEESEDKFWKPLISFFADSEWAKLVENYYHSTIESTIVYGANQITDIKNSTSEEAIENAKRDKEKGLIDQNVSLLRVASNQFLKLGDFKEHYLCLALKSRIEEKWKDAAGYYLKKEVGIEGIELAANIYWQGKMFSEIQKTTSITTKLHQLRLVVVKLFVDKIPENKEIRFLYEEREAFRKLLNSTTWRKEIIDKLLFFTKTTTDSDILKDLLDVFDEIGLKTDISLWEEVGQINFKLKRYDRAIESWEKINETQSLEYLEAKIELAKRKNNYGDVIFWLGEKVEKASQEVEKSNLENEIINTYISNIDTFNVSNNPYIYLFTFGAYLVQKPTDKFVIPIGQNSENGFTGIEGELIAFYQKLLRSKRLKSKMIINFVIDRWAKNCYKQDYDLDYINEEYKKLSSLNDTRYQLFSNEDLVNLPNFPSILQSNLPEKIETFTIHNFRRFKNLRIENLGLINLIVGDNNIGKTSFLEALLFTTNKSEYLKRLAFAYIERKNIQPDKEKKSDGERFFFQLSPTFLQDFKNANDLDNNIAFSFEKRRDVWEYEVVLGINQIDDKNDSQIILFAEEDYKSLNNLPFLDNIKQPIVPYGKGFGLDLAQIYHDEIGTKRQTEKDFMEYMKIFIPGIDRIIVDTRNGSIEIRDSEFPDDDIPLHQYGEGANKLFRILVQLILNKGRRIMIDEIDAGIHYTRFKQFWEIILSVAQKDNTQIFATTHNDECITYFVDVLETTRKSLQKDARVVQFKNVGDKLKGRSYEYSSFHLAIEDSIELRGGNCL